MVNELDFEEALYVGLQKVTLLSTKASGDFPVVVETYQGWISRYSRTGGCAEGGEPLVNGSVRYHGVDLGRFPDTLYFPTYYNNRLQSIEAACDYFKTTGNTHVLVVSKFGEQITSELVKIPKEIEDDQPE